MVLASSAVDAQYQGLAAGLMWTAYQLCGAVSAALADTLLTADTAVIILCAIVCCAAALPRVATRSPSPAQRDRGRQAAEPHARLAGPDGRSVALPEPMFEVLLQVAAAMKAGLAVTVAPHHLTLSTQEAADLLHISRTTLVRLLETGVIPFEKPSRHRKIRLDHLLEYRRRQRNAAELALTDMIADTERLSLYDVDPDQARAALKAARKQNQD